MRYTLHLQAHEGMERFENGVLSANKVDKLLGKAREWKFLGDSKIRVQFKWRIVRNLDGVIIAQSKNYGRDSQ